MEKASMRDCFLLPSHFHNAIALTAATAPAPARNIKGSGVRCAAFLVVVAVMVLLPLVTPGMVDCVVVVAGVLEAVPSATPVVPVVFVVVAGVPLPLPVSTTTKVAGYIPKKKELVSGTWKVIWLLWVHVPIEPVDVSPHEPVVGVGLPVKTHASRV
jgi:hypothetical protein